MPARRIIRLRVSLVGIEPEIWRTIDVDDSLTLARLHTVLQVVFHWFDSHLHRFSDEDPWARSNGIPRIGRKPRAWVDTWSLTEMDIEGDEDQAGTTVGEALQHDGPLWYVYDLGDNWLHRIDLIDRDTAKPGEPLAQLVSGERRAPFEDSGGITDTTSPISSPSHPIRSTPRSRRGSPPRSDPGPPMIWRTPTSTEHAESWRCCSVRTGRTFRDWWMPPLASAPNRRSPGSPRISLCRCGRTCVGAYVGPAC